MALTVKARHGSAGSRGDESVVRCIVVFVLLQLLFSASLVAVHCIPSSLMHRHAQAATIVFDDQYTWVRSVPGVETTRKDNYTDGIMLGEAIYEGTGNPLVDAFASAYAMDKQHLTGDTPDKWLGGYLAGYAKSFEPYEYSRYWHGYLVLLKPLLVLLNYQGIIVLNQTVQMILIAAVVVSCARRYGSLSALALGTALFLVTPASTALSLQYTWVFLISLCACLLIMRGGQRLVERGHCGELFLAIGSLTSFFDFLTYPTFTLTLPLLVLLLEYYREGHTLREAFFLLVRVGICWALGYGLTWVCKWVLSSIVLGKNCLPFDRIAMRSSSEVDSSEATIVVGYLDVLRQNVSVYNNAVYPLAAALVALSSLVLAVRHRHEVHLALPQFLCYLLVAAIPLAWVFVTKNHAYIHFWMTYRNLAIIPAALMLAVSGALGLNGGPEPENVVVYDSPSEE